jgi:fibronectin-binding autotransporter adhesin
MKRIFHLATACALLSHAEAQSLWSGAGPNSLWSTGTNWGSSAPVANANLQFGGSTQLNTQNDLTPFLNFNSITFNSGAGAFNLSGNSIYLSGNITNNSSSLQTVNLAMTLTFHRDFAGGTGGLVLSQPISQTAAYNVGIGAGTVYLTGAGSLPDTATLYMLGSSSVADLSGISAASETVAAIAAPSGGSILLGNKTLISSGGTTFAGSMSGTGGNFTKVGTNLLTLSGASFTHTGTTAVNAGSIRLRNSSISGGAITVASGARLYVAGNEGGFIGGTVTVASGGQMDVSGQYGGLYLASDTAITNNGSMGMSANGLVYTRLHLYGDATLGGTGTMTLNDSGYNTFSGEAGTEVLTHGAGHTIQGSGRIGVGTLGVINHGTILSNSTSNLRIEPNGAGFTNSATGIVRAVNGSTLTFENGSFTNSGLIDSAGTTEFKTASVTNMSGTIRASAGSLKVTGSTIIGGSVELSGSAGLNLVSGTLTGGSLTHGGTGALDSAGNPGAVSNVSSAVSLTASNTISAARPLNFTGGIAKGGVTTTFTGTAAITVSGTGISGAASDSHLITSASSLSLSAPNTYGGSTTISGGTLTVTGTGTLPDSSAVSLTASGASLNLSGITAGGETIGSLAGVTGTTVALGGKNLALGGDGTSTNFSGVISGSGASLTKLGGGTLTLSGANTYTGTTTVIAGTLAYGVNNALAAGSVVVDGSTAVLSLGSFSDTVGGLTLANGGSIATSGGILTSTTTYDVRSGNIGGGLAGTVGLQKSTSGTVSISGANSYSGTTSVQTGTLNITNSSGSATGTGTVTVDATATLSGKGQIEAGAAKYIFINGALVVGDSTLSTPVASAMKLTTSGGGSTVLGAGSSLHLDLFSSAGDLTASLAAADRIRLFGTLDPTLGGSIVLGNPNALAFVYGDRWTLFEVVGTNSILADIAIDTSALGLSPAQFAIFDRQDGTLSIVPEPGRVILFLTGLCSIFFTRRRAQMWC